MNYFRIMMIIIERGKTRTKEKGDGLHRHRIVPGYEGGTYSPENVTLLTRREHRIVHRLRWMIQQNQGDIWAATRLGGKLTDKEVERLKRVGSSLGGKITVGKMKSEGRGLFGLSPERKSEIGRKGGSRSKELNVGIFAMSKERLQDAQKKATETRNARLENDPEFRQKISDNGKLLAAKYLTHEVCSRGGKTCGEKNVESGHLKNISAMGGAAHRGRKQIVNSEGIVKRPRLEIAEGMVNSGEWKYLKKT